MPRIPFLALVFLAPGVSLAQNVDKIPSPDAFRNEAVVLERSETTFRMHADGTGERDQHVMMRIQSEGAAQQFGVLSFSYASANETPQIKLVRVHKAGGTVVDTPPDSAMDMPAEVTRQAPLYSDLKEKHVPVRSLAAGDTLEYEVNTRIDKAEAPGQFWGADHFATPGSVIVLAEILTLEVPAAKFVQVWSPNHKPTVTDANGVRTYTWNVPQLIPAPKQNDDEAQQSPAPKDPDEDDDGRKLPSVAWTTFHTWAEVGDWYRSLAQSRAKPTDAVRAKADQITAGAKSPEDQVRALYDFVSTQNRYVGIDFGIGRYQPHAAADVLANQYGDCKDKDTLLEALLQAKGFVTAPALIGAGIAPVPEVPSPAVFNHVITTVNLPGGRIWLDSTPGAAPYRYLSEVIRDQKALVVPPDGPASLVSTPEAPPYPLSAQFTAVGSLESDGKLTAKMTATYRDDDEVTVRALARNAAPAERDKVSHFLSSYSGFGGSTSNTAFQNAADPSQPIVVTYDYARHPFGDWDNLRIVPLFPALEFKGLSSDSKAPENDIQLGVPRTLAVTSRIHLADGFHADLPDPVHVKTDFATFDKTYRYENDEIVAERKIVILKRKVAKADWKQYQAFTKDIGLDNESWIQLIPSAKPATLAKTPDKVIKLKVRDVDAKTGEVTLAAPEKPAAETTANVPAAPPSDLPVTALIAQAFEKIRAKDWDGARSLLGQVKQKDPNTRGLWGEYGLLAEFVDHDLDAAKTDFGKELAIQPDNQNVVGALAELDVRTGDSTDARRVVSKFVDRHPENLPMAYYLASLQTAANDDEGALKTLQAAATLNPDNRLLATQVGDILVRLHRTEEAAASARSALDGSDDPEVLNGGAYILSEAGLNLSLAEEASRKGIAKLEEESAGITTEEANSKAFARAKLLIYSWDTLGWILYREGKNDEAMPFISAAWRGSLQPDIGDHLAQLYEAAGQKKQAYETYALASTAIDRATSPTTRTHLAESLGRLRPSDAKPGRPLETEALQALRTYKIHKPDGVGGWGTFRLQITAEGVIEAQRMSGDAKLDAFKKALSAMKFPELMPPGSKAHLLRIAVVSCSMGSTCEIVFVPDGGLQTEMQ